MSELSPQLVTEINALLSRYETKRSAILPILHRIQDTYGWVKPEHIMILDKDFGLNRVHVKEVLTFYSMYRTEEPEKHRILFCDNIVCSMMGAKEAMHEIESYINEKKKNKKPCPISLHGVPCLGVCDGAPAMLVNKDRHLRVTKQNVRDILSKLE